MVPVLPDSALDGPSYGEWSQEKYSGYLSLYTGIPKEHLSCLQIWFAPSSAMRQRFSA